MGLLSFLRKRKEKKRFQEISDRYENEVLYEDRMSDRGYVKKYLIEQCEEVAAEATELASIRKEYTSVTNYLKDIEIINQMDSLDHEKCVDIATNIITLNKTREGMKKKANRLPDSQFHQIQELEDEIPKSIMILRDNERREGIIKRDLDYLEGEKLEWIYERDGIKDEIRLLKNVLRSLLLVIGLILSVVVVMVISEKERYISIPIIFASLIAIIEILIVLRMQTDRTLVKQCAINYNRAVSIQNKIKIKYINIANAIDYAHEKYHVKNAMELENDWQLYLEAVKEREKLKETNDDLSYYKNLLVRLLRMYNLYDAAIWPYQAEAIANPKEMVEVKHELLERRQRLRSRMEGLLANVTEGRNEINNIATEHDLMTKEVAGILKSVDEIIKI